MADRQAKVAPPPGLPRRILRRLLWFVLLAAVASGVMGWAMSLSSRAGEPAGFSRGVLHGAMMPAALPRLLIGQDVTIYAAVNTGRTYKLGYTVGVNGCGAIFFGFNFWRLNRWRRRQTPSSKNQTPEKPQTPTNNPRSALESEIGV